MEPAERPTARFEITEARDKTRVWSLTLQAASLVIEPPDGEARTIARAQLATEIDVDPLFVFGFLSLRAKPKVTFALATEAREALIAWMGPPTRADLRGALQRRHNWVALAVGAFLVVSAGPWLIPESARGIDWLMVIWGGTSVLLWGLVRVATHRAWFAVDGVIQTAIAAWFVHGVITGERHPAWCLLLLLAFLGFSFSMKQYRRFANVTS